MEIKNNNIERNTIFQAAIKYAKVNIPVFPVHSIIDGTCTCKNKSCHHPGKHPITKHGYKDASTDLAIINQYWEQFPFANVAIATGKKSGLIVLDIDPRNGGEDSLNKLIKQCGSLPNTLTVISGSGGLHLYFSAPKEPIKSQSNFRPGIDIQAENASIIAPPSDHISGNKYGFKNKDKPAELPLYLLNLLPKKNQHVESSKENDTDGAIIEGTRNSTLTSIGGKLRYAGEECNVIEDALLSINKLRCVPPLEEDEVKKIAESICRYPIGYKKIYPKDINELEWPPIINIDEITPPPFPIEALPTPLKEYSIALSEFTETPIELPALTTLGMVSIAISGKVIVEVKKDYFEPTNLWIAVALDPSNRKTPILVKCSSPIRYCESEQAAILKPQIMEVMTKRKLIEEQIKKLTAQVNEDKNNSHEIHLKIIQLEQSKPDLINYPCLISEDSTPEALSQIMNQNGEKMAIVSDEGGILEILKGRYSKQVPNLDIYLKSYSSSPIRIDRKHDEPIIMRNPCLTIVITPQPTILSGLAGNSHFRERGISSRFLFCLPKTKLGFRQNKGPLIPEEVEFCYREKIKQLLGIQSANIIKLTLSPEAFGFYDGFWHETERRMRPDEDLAGIADWAGKLSGNAIRLAAILHMAEKDFTKDLIISGETMSRANAIAEALIPHALATFNLVSRPPEYEAAKKIVRWVNQKQLKNFTHRDCHARFKDNVKKSDDLKPILEILAERSYIRGPINKGKSSFYEVNPSLLNN